MTCEPWAMVTLENSTVNTCCLNFLTLVKTDAWIEWMIKSEYYIMQFT